MIEHNFENAADLRGLLQSQPLKFGKVDDSVLRLTNRVSDKIESVFRIFASMEGGQKWGLAHPTIFLKHLI